MKKNPHCNYADEKCDCLEHQNDKLHCCMCDPKSCKKPVIP